MAEGQKGPECLLSRAQTDKREKGEGKRKASPGQALSIHPEDRNPSFCQSRKPARPLQADSAPPLALWPVNQIIAVILSHYTKLLL